VLAVFGLVFAASRSAIACVLTAFVIQGFLDIRPHLITLLFTAILLATRQRPWAPWLWPPLVAIWANLHGGYAFGVGAIAVIAVFQALRGAPRGRLAWGVGLSLLAMLANPWGYRLLAYPLDYLHPDSPFRTIFEWRPPPFGLDPRGYQGRFWGFALLAALGLPAALRRDDARDLAVLGLVTFAMAATSRRFIPLFAVTAAPLVGFSVRALGARLRPGPRGRLALTAAAVAAAAFLVHGVRLHPRALDRWTRADLYPEAGVAALNAMGPPRRVLNDYVWGGYILLHAPGAQVFIDQRANTLYDEAIVRDYRFLTTGKPGARQRLAAYGADAALVRTGSPMAAGLRREPGGWIPVYTDTLATLLVPPDAPHRAPIAPAGDPPELRLRRAAAAEQRGDLAGAAAILEEAIAADPLLMRSYGQLARIRARAGDAAGVRRAIERGLRAQPRRRDDLYEAEARAWESAGRPARALEALDHVGRRGPFDDRRRIDAWIAELELKLRPAPDRE
jgi:tetratricopeptide (TPR) repeat protein